MTGKNIKKSWNLEKVKVNSSINHINFLISNLIKKYDNLLKCDVIIYLVTKWKTS